MNKDKDIKNYNDKGQYHGYQEIYNWNNKLWVRDNYKNGNKIGYQENHLFKATSYFIK